MKKYLYILLSFLTLTNIGLLGYTLFKAKVKTGYIVVAKVYEGFVGKQLVEKQLKSLQDRQNGILDTLRLSITAMQTRLQDNSDKKIEDALKMKMGDYDRLVEEFSNFNENESQKHIDGLTKQINQYVMEYGKENNYDYILGATGDGSLMYAKSSNDITDEIITYVNKKYADQ